MVKKKRTGFLTQLEPHKEATQNQISSLTDLFILIGVVRLHRNKATPDRIKSLLAKFGINIPENTIISRRSRSPWLFGKGENGALTMFNEEVGFQLSFLLRALAGMQKEGEGPPARLMDWAFIYTKPTWTPSAFKIVRLTDAESDEQMRKKRTDRKRRWECEEY